MEGLSGMGEQTTGTAPTFEEARADSEVAWQAFSARRTPADYQKWRHQRDWTARIRHVGTQRTAAIAEAELPDALSVWRDVR